MKKVKNYAGNLVNAYQIDDLIKNAPLFAAAESIWYDSWLKSGMGDVGTCCGGKGIQVYYIAKRCRKLSQKIVVPCSFVQGNVAASVSVKPALEFLKNNGIEASYYDGWMD